MKRVAIIRERLRSLIRAPSRMSTPRRVATGGALGLGMGLLAVLLSMTPQAGRIERVTYDLRFQRRGNRTSRAKVVVVALDPETLDYDTKPLALWGDHFGKAITVLRDLGADAIGFDIIHNGDAPESSQEDPGQLQTLLVKANRDLRRAILTAEGRVVLPEHFAHHADGRLWVKSGSEALNTAANEAAGGPDRGVGFVDASPDEDNVEREHAPLIEDPTGEKPIPRPTFSLLLAQRSDPNVSTRPFIVNYVGPSQAIPHISFLELLRVGAAQDARLQRLVSGAIVIIGRTDEESGDFSSTPAGRMEGSEIQANLVATMLDRRPIHRAGETLDRRSIHQFGGNPVRWGLLLFGAVLGALIMGTGPLRAASAVLLLMAIWTGTTVWALRTHDLWLPLTEPMLAVILVFIADFAWRQSVSDHEIKSLGRCVGPTVLQEVQNNPDVLDSAGREYDLTVMFTDIRGFTAWSQGRSPTEVFGLLSRVGNLLTPLVFAEGGTVDKFLGDGMMAFFGAPIARGNHAARALRCALAIQEAITADPELTRMFPGLRIGIGLQSGPAVVGFLKTHQTPYTAVGDTVNLASRLEAATKQYMAEIVLSRRTFEASGARGLADVCGFVTEGPFVLLPHNHDPVPVYILRKRTEARNDPAEGRSSLQDSIAG